MLIIVFILLVFVYSLLSRRLEETVFSIPLVFTLAGILLALTIPKQARQEVGGQGWLFMAEITYAIVIFNGATQVKIRALRRQMQLPARLLLVGLPLAILFGILAALLFLPGLSLWEAGILACMLASTDTSLAEVVIRSSRVPVRIREALKLESGLSDGLIVPFVMLFISLAKTDSAGLGIAFLRFTGQQIGLGIPIGAAIGLMGGWLVGLAQRRNWALASFQQIAVIALVPLCWMLSKVVGISPFITAFAAGIAVRTGFRKTSDEIVEFSKNEGRLLYMFTFYFFGASIGSAWGGFSLASFLFAILSLTLVRMLSVSISLIGTRLSAATVLFIGWFGPRGLASIILGLVILGQQIQTSGSVLIKQSLILTVLLSIFAHGLSASKGIRLYAGRIARLPSHAAEYEATTGLQTI